jgi:hypothetical protein
MMGRITPADSLEAMAAVRALFEETPVLVEVRFPNCGTSPNWHLINAEEEIDQILVGLAPGAELFLNREWDLTNPSSAVRLRK